MSTVTVRTSSSTVVFPDASARLVESRASEYVPDGDGFRLAVVDQGAVWTITTPARVGGWMYAVRKTLPLPGARTSAWEYTVLAEHVLEVTVDR